MLENLESVVLGTVCSPGAVTEPARRGILVVEDNVVLRELLARVLSSAGYQVWSAGEFSQALDLYNCHSLAIGLLLLDVDLRPGPDGPEVLAAIRQECPRIPCCFLTAGSLRYTAEDLLACGGQVVLSKPFNLSDLEQTVDRLLR